MAWPELDGWFVEEGTLEDGREVLLAEDTLEDLAVEEVSLEPLERTLDDDEDDDACDCSELLDDGALEDELLGCTGTCVVMISVLSTVEPCETLVSVRVSRESVTLSLDCASTTV